MDHAEAVELSSPVYFPNSTPVLAILFSQMLVVKAFVTHKHLRQVDICHRRLEVGIHRYARRINILTLSSPSLLGTSVRGLSWLHSCYGLYAVFKKNGKLL
jgi:hypothetical protein